jgi:hypothetical protein
VSAHVQQIYTCQGLCLEFLFELLVVAVLCAAEWRTTRGSAETSVLVRAPTTKSVMTARICHAQFVKCTVLPLHSVLLLTDKDEKCPGGRRRHDE